MYVRQKLSDGLTRFRSRLFPYEGACASLTYNAVIGVGGNIGNTLRRFNHLFWYLKRSRCIDICQTSSILKNPPFGYLDQPFFYNAVILVKTDLSPRKLLRFLLNVEKKFGRKRSFENAPRTLDLDILFFDDKKIESKDLTIPHKEWHKRQSVLVPLMEFV